MEKLWMKENEELYSLLHSDPRGLTTGEARTRLEKYGENKLPDKAKKSMLTKIWEQVSDFLIIILLWTSPLTKTICLSRGTGRSLYWTNFILKSFAKS